MSIRYSRCIVLSALFLYLSLSSCSICFQELGVEVSSYYCRTFFLKFRPFLFHMFWGFIIWCVKFMIIITYCWIESLIYNILLCFLSFLKSTFSYINIATSVLFWLLFAWNICFFFTFNLFVSLDLKWVSCGNSLIVQWLGFCTFTAGCTGSIAGQGTKIPHATWCSQKQKKLKSAQWILCLFSVCAAKASTTMFI